jgi:predicted adenylyl cyclase CyaB
MIELELKAVVSDTAAVVERLRRAGAIEEFQGQLLDRRLDFADGHLAARDEVIRIRVYRDASGNSTAAVEWKGPATVANGYKRREEVGTKVDDPGVLLVMLQRLGLGVVRAIDRQIHQFRIAGAMVRLEHYARMDDLVEVEGEPAQIENAIGAIGIPREHFSAEPLAAFISRYETRSGQSAITGPRDHAADFHDG